MDGSEIIHARDESLGHLRKVHEWHGSAAKPTNRPPLMGGQVVALFSGPTPAVLYEGACAGSLSKVG